MSTDAGKQLLADLEWKEPTVLGDCAGFWRAARRTALSQARSAIPLIEAEAVAALAAERDRFREALEQIADTFDTNDECRWCGTEIDTDHYEDCASVVARAALAPGTPVDVE